MNPIIKTIKESGEEIGNVFCVMLERADRDNGESCEEWKIKLENDAISVGTEECFVLFMNHNLNIKR